MTTASLISIFPFLAVAFTLIFCGAYILLSSKSPNNWPIAEGTITKSELKFETKGGENTEIMKCEPKVNFQFSIDDRLIEGSTVSFSKKPIDRVEAQEIIDTYSIGEKVEVYYNPKNPEMAVLEANVNNLGYLFIGIGLVFGIIPLVTVLSRL
jgi:hypothetical protein